MRSEMIYPQAVAELDQLIAENKEKLGKIYRYFVLSGKFDVDPFYTDLTAEDKTKDFITKQIKQAINTDFTIDEQYSIPRFIHQDEIKSPIKSIKKALIIPLKAFKN